MERNEMTKWWRNAKWIQRDEATFFFIDCIILIPGTYFAFYLILDVKRSQQNVLPDML